MLKEEDAAYVQEKGIGGCYRPVHPTEEQLEAMNRAKAILEAGLKQLEEEKEASAKLS